MKKLIRSNSDVNGPTQITASHIHVKDDRMKRMLASDAFEFFNEAYKHIGGFKSFTGEDDFADRSFYWYITYKGRAPENMADIDFNNVYTVSVFKQKHGLKLVGLGNNRFTNITDPDERKKKKMEALDAMSHHIKRSMQIGWGEVSNKLEDLFKHYLSPKQIIEPEMLKENLADYKDIEILPDNLHYNRYLGNGDKVTKIAFGNIKI